jgi:hypothetical protein
MAFSQDLDLYPSWDCHLNRMFYYRVDLYYHLRLKSDPTDQHDHETRIIYLLEMESKNTDLGSS